MFHPSRWRPSNKTEARQQRAIIDGIRESITFGVEETGRGSSKDGWLMDG